MMVIGPRVVARGSGSGGAIRERGLTGARRAARSPRRWRRGGIKLIDLDAVVPLDLASTGADAIDPQLGLIKGAGGACPARIWCGRCAALLGGGPRPTRRWSVLGQTRASRGGCALRLAPRSPGLLDASCRQAIYACGRLPLLTRRGSIQSLTRGAGRLQHRGTAAALKSNRRVGAGFFLVMRLGLPARSTSAFDVLNGSGRYADARHVVAEPMASASNSCRISSLTCRLRRARRASRSDASRLRLVVYASTGSKSSKCLSCRPPTAGATQSLAGYELLYLRLCRPLAKIPGAPLSGGALTALNQIRSASWPTGCLLCAPQTENPAAPPGAAPASFRAARPRGRTSACAQLQSTPSTESSSIPSARRPTLGSRLLWKPNSPPRRRLGLTMCSAKSVMISAPRRRASRRSDSAHAPPRRQLEDRLAGWAQRGHHLLGTGRDACAEHVVSSLPSRRAIRSQFAALLPVLPRSTTPLPAAATLRCTSPGLHHATCLFIPGPGLEASASPTQLLEVPSNGQPRSRSTSFAGPTGGPPKIAAGSS